MSKRRSADQISINIFDRIDSLCATFRTRWKQGKRPRIEEFLDQVGDDAKANLFRNLLQLDIRFRQRNGEHLDSNDYLQRFPQFTTHIRQAFDESTLISDVELHGTPTDDFEDPTIHFEGPATERLGDYELLRELGRGGFGVVYEARHIQRGDRVALKTLPTGVDGPSHAATDAMRLHSFRREFRSLSEVNHPNLVGMQSLEVDGNQWFFTMDLVEGVRFLEYVRPGGKLNEDRLRTTLPQLVRGIAALHQRGTVHRDLKPGNVLVNDEGHLVILDFGLAAELQQRADQTISTCFAGTPRYAAPEQATGKRSTATDWYSVGVMVYEALTGETPFRGASSIDVILQKQEQDAPQLEGNSDLPQDLAKLVDRLLQRVPEQRPDADAIFRSLGIAVEPVGHDSVDSSQISGNSRFGSLLIGREEQLSRLETACQEFLKRREPVVVFIRGRSGEGKTTLASRFLTPLQRDNAMVVLSGRCYDRESVPFKAIDSLIDALVVFLRSRSPDEIERILPDDIGMLAQLFPVLRRVEAITDRPAQRVSIVDSRQTRYRAFAALREMLSAISQATPLVLFIDDLQWGDGDSAAVLYELLSPPNPPAVMLLGSYRSDEAEESPYLKEWRARDADAEHAVREAAVEVTPLTEEQCVSLFAASLGQDSEVVREQAKIVFQQAQGNPYFLEQLIDGFDSETCSLQQVPLNEIIARKLARLPEEANALLEAVAVAGQGVSLDEANGVSGRGNQAFATITHMRSERLVRIIGSGEQRLIDTYHDKIRETVLDGLSDTKRRELHVRFGELQERNEDLDSTKILQYLGGEATAPTTTDRIFDIAYHFQAAGDPRGFAYQLMAGEQSHQAYASEDAVDFLKRAEASLPDDASEAIRFRLWERLAGSYARLQMFEPALQIYDRCLQCAPSRLALAQAHIGIAQIHQVLGRYKEATANFDLALKAIGRQRPTTLGAILSTPKLAAKVFLVPFRWQQDRDREQNALVQLEQEVYIYLPQYCIEQDLPLSHYLHATFKQASTAVQTGRSDQIARGLSYLACLMAMNGLSSLGKRVLKKSAKIAQELGDLQTEGFYLAAAAITNANSREAALADTQFRDALPLMRKCGAHSSAIINAHLHRHLHAVIGSSSLERETAEQVLRLAAEAGDIRGQCWGNYDIANALARAGDIESAKFQIERAREFLACGEMLMTETILLGTQGYVLLQSSEYEAARTVCEESWRMIRCRKIFIEYTLRSLPLLIESIVGPQWLTSEDLHHRKQLLRLCRAARLIFWFYPNIQSPIERARGRAFWLLGKRNKAIRCLRRAVKCAATVQGDYDRARSMLDLAAVQEQDRVQLRREAVEILKRTESVIPYAERWLLGDQYEAQCVAPAPAGRLP